MGIVIRTVGGAEWLLEVRSDDTVDGLKGRLGRANGVAPDRLILVGCPPGSQDFTNELLNGKSLAEYEPWKVLMIQELPPIPSQDKDTYVQEVRRRRRIPSVGKDAMATDCKQGRVASKGVAEKGPLRGRRMPPVPPFLARFASCRKDDEPLQTRPSALAQLEQPLQRCASQQLQTTGQQFEQSKPPRHSDGMLQPQPSPSEASQPGPVLPDECKLLWVAEGRSASAQPSRSREVSPVSLTLPATSPRALSPQPLGSIHVGAGRLAGLAALSPVSTDRGSPRHLQHKGALSPKRQLQHQFIQVAHTQQPPLSPSSPQRQQQLPPNPHTQPQQLHSHAGSPQKQGVASSLNLPVGSAKAKLDRPGPAAGTGLAPTMQRFPAVPSSLSWSPPLTTMRADNSSPPSSARVVPGSGLQVASTASLHGQPPHPPGAHPALAAPGASSSTSPRDRAGASSAQSGGGQRGPQHRVRKQDLQWIGKLGVGAFGVVTLEADRRTGNTYALKAVSKGYLAKLKMEYSVVHEKNILKMVDSPFVVRLIATYNGREHVYFLLEACLGGELFTTYERLRLYGSEPHAKFYVGCVAEALTHLHERHVIYRDLKPENLLLDARGYCKLTDMGLAKIVKPEERAMSVVGTPDYMAPEVICQTGHHQPVDWWMLGVLVFELLVGRAPFEAESTPQIYELVKQGIDHVRFPRECPPRAQELVRSLCRHNPDTRNRTPVLRNHSFFKDFDWGALRALRMRPPYEPRVRHPRDMSNFRTCDGEDPPAEAYSNNGTGWDIGFEDDALSAPRAQSLNPPPVGEARAPPTVWLPAPEERSPRCEKRPVAPMGARVVPGVVKARPAAQSAVRWNSAKGGVLLQRPVASPREARSPVGSAVGR